MAGGSGEGTGVSEGAGEDGVSEGAGDTDGGAGGASPNAARTVSAARTASVHGAVPEQPGASQPSNVEPAAAEAVRVTVAPSA